MNNAFNKIKLYLPLVLVLLLLVSNNSRAQDSKHTLIEVESRVDTSVITIGDRVTYSIIINYREGLRTERPGEGVNLGMFQIKDYKVHDPKKQNGRIIEHFDYHISVYDTGHYTIPAFPIAYFPSDSSNDYRIIEADPIDITVKSILSGDGARELKDIKPPKSIPFNYAFWISMAVIVLLLGIIGYIGYRMWKKRKEKGYLFTPPKPPRPAHEVALEQLQVLFNSQLISQKKYKIFFTELSNIMRSYLEKRFFIPALEETTTGILRNIHKHINDEDDIQQLRDVLFLADMVKFAKHIPDEASISKARQAAVRFVEDTKLVYHEQVVGQSLQDGSSVGEPKGVNQVKSLPESNQKNVENKNGGTGID
ncbi:MAG: hypothetical protein GF313_07055 [Caldithrix sp.]|nr:hypothetical protein [Caldithrix sp.]